MSSARSASTQSVPTGRSRPAVLPRFSLGDVRRGAALVIAADFLFGLSTPAAKAIVGNVAPLLLAGLLYLGSGLGLGMMALLGHRRGAGLKQADMPWLLTTILFGGILGPGLLMWGLARSSASAASLLLSLEGVFTALLAWIVFREPFNPRVGIGMALVCSGAIVIGVGAPRGHGDLLGSIAVAGTGLCWAIDNNCTARISKADALTLTSVKALAAGCVNCALALATGASLPVAGIVAASALVGFLGYGLSLVLYVMALREIGAARTGLYFAMSPFIGSAAGVVALGEPLTQQLIAAGLLIGTGAFLHLSE